MDKLQPVAWIIESDEEFKNGKNYPTLDWYVKDILNLPIGTKLYTHPVKELTDEKITTISKKIFKDYKNFHHYQIDFARAVIKEVSGK